MADFKKVMLTNAGRNLMAKILAMKTVPNITRMGIGDGTTRVNVEDMTEMVSMQMVAPVVDKRSEGVGFVRLTARFSNDELTEGFFINEIGVFAKDPDLGEILYAYTDVQSHGDFMPSIGGATSVTEEINCIIDIGNARDVILSVDSNDFYMRSLTVYQDGAFVGDAKGVDFKRLSVSVGEGGRMEVEPKEIYALLALKLNDALYQVPVEIAHNLGRYPLVIAMKVTNGAGCGGAGVIPAGGDNVSEFVRYSYLDRNNLMIYLSQEYRDPKVDRIDGKQFVLSFSEVEHAYQVLLY